MAQNFSLHPRAVSDVQREPDATRRLELPRRAAFGTPVFENRWRGRLSNERFFVAASRMPVS